MFIPDYQKTHRDITMAARLPLVCLTKKTQQRFSALLGDSEHGNLVENKELARLALSDIMEARLIKAALARCAEHAYQQLPSDKQFIYIQLYLADELLSLLAEKASQSALHLVIPSCVDKFLTTTS